MAAEDHVEWVHAETRHEWRCWLAANHAGAAGVWLSSPGGGRRAGLRSAMPESVEEALCFG